MARIVKITVVVGLLVLCGSAWAVDSNGLVAHWKLDEVSGGTAYDSAGDNDGTLVNGPAWTVGQIDGGLGFDGINDSVDVGDPPDGSLDFGTADFTLSVWFKTSIAPGFFVCKRAKGYYAGYDFYTEPDGKIFARIADGSSISDARTTAGFNDGLWHYAVAVYDRDGVIRIYVDGVSKATSGSIGGIGSVNNSEPFTIGDRNDPGHHSYFEGNLDDVRVYSRALSAEEVEELYSMEMSAHERAIMKVEDAVGKKQAALETIEEALDEEWDAYGALEEMLESKDYGDLNKRDIIKARQEIHSAMQRQEQAGGALDRSIEGLYDALESLGWEPNLVAHWKFDEGSGGTAYDSAGDNDGTVNGATWTSGKINGALDFDGVDDYVRINDSPELSPPKITLTAWINPDDVSHNFQIICKWTRHDPEYLFDNKINNDALRFGSRFEGDTFYDLHSNDAVLTVGTWQHVAVTWDGSTAVFYVNGVNAGEDNSCSGDLPDSDNDVYIGYGVGISGPRPFDGSIDDVRIYDRALTSGEILQLYADGL